MKTFYELDPIAAAKVRYILFDIDGTITTGGRSQPRRTIRSGGSGAGYRPIPVTGRPAGWCDLIVRRWPVAAVVGKTGPSCSIFRQPAVPLCTSNAAPKGFPRKAGRHIARRDAKCARVPAPRKTNPTGSTTWPSTSTRTRRTSASKPRRRYKRYAPGWARRPKSSARSTSTPGSESTTALHGALFPSRETGETRPKEHVPFSGRKFAQ